MRGLRLLAVIGVLCCVINGQARAEPLTFDLVNDYVGITTGFAGVDFVLFGNQTEAGDVVVVIEGPKRDSVVRKKEQVFGAWINTLWLKFKDSPSYYDYASTDEEVSGMLSEDILIEKRIGLGALKGIPEEERYDEIVVKNFQNALVRNKQGIGLYPKAIQDVKLLGDGLFRVDFKLPPNVPSGVYTVRALLVRGNEVVYEKSKPLNVGLEGFSSNVYEMAHNHSFLYGMMCVVIALFAGWLSNTIVRRN